MLLRTVRERIDYTSHIFLAMYADMYGKKNEWNINQKRCLLDSS